MRRTSTSGHSLRIGILVLLSTTYVTASCAEAPSDDAPADAESEMFTGPKADGFCADPGSAEAEGVLRLVNDQTVTFEDLDLPVASGGAGLNRTAARNIVDRRPFATLDELDAVPYVGVSACSALVDFACDERGLCEAQVCDAESFPARPARTRYDARCESMLLAIVAGTLSSQGGTTVDDAGMRCEALSDLQRLAFDAAVSEYDEPPATFSESFGAFEVEVFATADSEVAVAHVVEENNSTPFHVVLDAGSVAAIWTTDGLSAGADWYCGGTAGAEPADSPEDFCIGAMTDDALWCADPQRSEEAVTVAEAREDFSSLSAGAVVVFADELGLPDEEVVNIASNACGDRSAEVTLRTAEHTATFRVVDSARGLGRTVLTRSRDGNTEIVCAYPNG